MPVGVNVGVCVFVNVCVCVVVRVAVAVSIGVWAAVVVGVNAPAGVRCGTEILDLRNRAVNSAGDEQSDGDSAPKYLQARDPAAVQAA